MNETSAKQLIARMLKEFDVHVQRETAAYALGIIDKQVIQICSSSSATGAALSFTLDALLAEPGQSLIKSFPSDPAQHILDLAKVYSNDGLSAAQAYLAKNATVTKSNVTIQ